jgi:hypothetical protein
LVRQEVPAETVQPNQVEVFAEGSASKKICVTGSSFMSIFLCGLAFNSPASFSESDGMAG